jgi:hypothetical protein
VRGPSRVESLRKCWKSTNCRVVWKHSLELKDEVMVMSEWRTRPSDVGGTYIRINPLGPNVMTFCSISG